MVCRGGFLNEDGRDFGIGCGCNCLNQDWPGFWDWWDGIRGAVAFWLFCLVLVFDLGCHFWVAIRYKR